jgi:acyl-CoA dehydrogenase
VSASPALPARGEGVSDDVPLAAMYGWRSMRIFDGPDEVT